MARKLTIAPHLPIEELQRRYRAAEDPVARSHWQILWLLAQGLSTAEVARVTSYGVGWVQGVARRYRDGGPEAVADRRHGNPGAAPLAGYGAAGSVAGGLGRAGTGWWAVDGAPGGHLDEPGTGPPHQSAKGLGVAAAARLHPATAPATGHAHGPRGPGSLQKGGLADALAAVRQTAPQADIAVWAEDEHRLGLLPVRRRLWAPRGQRPTAHVQRHYEGLSVYGFVRPSTGQSWWCLLPTVTTEAFALALATFARDEGIEAAHRAVLVVDQAGWHLAHEVAIPEGIDLVFLPPASPELQPAERLWPLIDEPVANRAFADLAALETVLVTRCRQLEADRLRLRAHTRFHWWPAEPSPTVRQ
jgi:transposase